MKCFWFIAACSVMFAVEEAQLIDGHFLCVCGRVYVCVCVWILCSLDL